MSLLEATSSSQNLLCAAGVRGEQTTPRGFSLISRHESGSRSYTRSKMGSRNETEAILRFGVFELDLRTRELRKRGIRVRLNGRPYSLLVILLNRPGEVVSREEMRSALWPDQPWGDHDQQLNKIINKVRDALGDSAESPRYIETIARVGYRLLVEVQQIAPASAVKTAEATEEAVPAQPDSQTMKRLWHRVVPASAALLATAAVLLLWSRRDQGGATALIPTALTNYQGAETSPSFSPDGSQVAFAWNGENQDDFDIYVLELGSQKLRRIIREPGNDEYPAWSPDGRQIAFAHAGGGDTTEIRVVDVSAGGWKAVARISSRFQGRPFAWSRDGLQLLLADASPEKGQSAIYALPLAGGSRREVVEAGDDSWSDFSPAVSPAGHQVAFVRQLTTSWREIFIQDVTGDLRPVGRPRQVTQAKIEVDEVAWTADGSELVYSAGPLAGARSLYRVRVDGEGEPKDLGGVRLQGTAPAIAPGGHLLAFVRTNIEGSSIWRLDPRSGNLTRVLASASRDWTADLSPDGKQVAFSSSRSGSPVIWVCDADGSSLRRMTRLGDAGGSMPRWSPDGRLIAFESRPNGNSDIYTLDPTSGSIHRLTNHPDSDHRASWARDGRFIYFTSRRTGRPEIWRIPSGGGEPVQVTSEGGLYGLESHDGKSLIFTRGDPEVSVYEMPVAGGEVRQVAEGIAGPAAMALSSTGLYFYSRAEGGKPSVLQHKDLRSGETKTVNVFTGKAYPVLSATANADWLLLTRIEPDDRDLVLVRGFR